MRSISFEDGSFDSVLCSEVLEHIFPYETAIAEIVRVVRPGGWVALSVPRAQRKFAGPFLTPITKPQEATWIFEEPALQRAAEGAGLLRGILRRPYVARTHWWLRCLFGGDDAATEAWPVRLWHRLLLWDLLRPRPSPERSSAG